jgi:hypothetical protein
LPLRYKGRGEAVYLSKALEILVKDWQKLYEEEETELSVAAVVEKLNIGSLNDITPNLKPGQIADLIESDLRQIPGALGICGAVRHSRRAA